MNFKRSHRACAARSRPAPVAIPPSCPQVPKLSAARGAGGQSAIRSFLCLGNRYALTILTVLMWRWCRRRWVLDGSLRVWLAGKFFAGPRTSRSFPCRLWAARGNHFALQPTRPAAVAPPEARAPSGARRGYLGTGPTLVSKFFNFFLQQQKLFGSASPAATANTRQRLTLTTGH